MAHEKSSGARCLQNREVSWLMFNRRVLEQANCVSMPLLERLKFISIFTTNLDEFYMVRVGSLTDSAQFSPNTRENKTGCTPSEQLLEINKNVLPLYDLRSLYFSAIMSRLERYGLHHCSLSLPDPEQEEYLRGFFQNSILPMLSPQIIDNRHPFPHIANKQLHVAVSLEKKNKHLYGIIAVPQNLDRIVRFGEKGQQFVLLEELIYHFADLIFTLYKVTERTILAITRNADISTEEELLDEDIDYRKHMSKMIQNRRRMAPVRLELQNKIGDAFLNFLCEKVSLQTRHIYVSQTPLDFTYIFQLGALLDEKDKARLSWESFLPHEKYKLDRKTSVLKYVQKKDMLLSLPYESMSPFLLLIHQAAEDPGVVSIKITLYRLARQSKLAEYLILAAENGKEVVVLMELRARFDEQNNIEWANRLEEAGCRVIYGPAMYKTHSKICLITKREFGKVSYITQVGTGNYNESTAKLYTDLSLITANPLIGYDAANFFNNMLLGNLEGDYRYLWTSPQRLKQNFMECVQGEIDKVRQGLPGSIVAKCNSLTDKDIILQLLEASRQGVKITLIIRGICCLLPQIPDFTENIRIISIVGRFLEHSRVYCFGTGPDMRLFISSADLMTRNTERRVEVACPVYDAQLRQKIYKMLEYMMEDNVKAWELFSDGEYRLRQPNMKPEINAQALMMAADWDGDFLTDTPAHQNHFLLRFLQHLLKKRHSS